MPGAHARSDCLDNLSSLTPATNVGIPTALAHTTVGAMLRFAAGRPVAGVVSAEALAWTLQTLRIMRMTRLATICVLLASGFAATGAAMIVVQEREPAQTRSVAPNRTSAPDRNKARSTELLKDRVFSVRVIDTRGKGVPDVNIKVVEEYSMPADDESASRTATYRTGADGQLTSPWTGFNHLTFEARTG